MYAYKMGSKGQRSNFWNKSQLRHMGIFNKSLLPQDLHTVNQQKNKIYIATRRAEPMNPQYINSIVVHLPLFVLLICTK